MKPKGDEQTRFDLYSGLTIPEFGGVVKDGSRTEIPANNFSNLENVRFEEGEIRVRGGQSKDTPSPLLGTLVSGIYHPGWGKGALGGPKVCYFMQRQTAPAPPTAAMYFTGSPVVSAQPLLLWDGSSSSPVTNTGGPSGTCALNWLPASHLILRQGRRGYPVSDDNEIQAAIFTGSNDFLAGADDGSSILYLYDEGGDIYTWDGSDLTLLDDGLLSGSIGILMYFNSELYQLNRSGSTIKKRNGGAWDVDISLPGGLPSNKEWRSWVVHNGDLYIGGVTTDGGSDDNEGTILKLTTGGVCTEENTAAITGGESSYEPYPWLASDGTDLFYTVNGEAYAGIGRFNGSTWDNSYKDLTSQMTGNEALVAFGYYATNSRLVAVESAGYLFQSPASPYTAAWTRDSTQRISGGAAGGDALFDEVTS